MGAIGTDETIAVGDSNAIMVCEAANISASPKWGDILTFVRTPPGKFRDTCINSGIEGNMTDPPLPLPPFPLSINKRVGVDLPSSMGLRYFR